MKTTYVQIGKTRKMHGVQGQIKMDIDAIYEEGFEDLKVLFVESGSRKTPYFIENIDFNSGLFLVKLEEIDSKEAAQPLTNKLLFARENDITRSEGDMSEDDELAQFIGYHIQTTEGENIGVIHDVQEFPQQIMAFVEYNKDEVLIPLNEAFIKDILPDQQIIVMDLPEGLLEV